jgi:hypothetical protein
MSVALLLFAGWVMAFILPKKIIPQRVAEGKITAAQALLTAKVGRVCGCVLMVFAALDLIYFGLIRGS